MNCYFSPAQKTWSVLSPMRNPVHLRLWGLFFSTRRYAKLGLWSNPKSEFYRDLVGPKGGVLWDRKSGSRPTWVSKLICPLWDSGMNCQKYRNMKWIDFQAGLDTKTKTKGTQATWKNLSLQLMSQFYLTDSIQFFPPPKKKNITIWFFFGTSIKITIVVKSTPITNDLGHRSGQCVLNIYYFWTKIEGLHWVLRTWHELPNSGLVLEWITVYM